MASGKGKRISADARRTAITSDIGNSLNGMDIFTLRILMGHGDLQIWRTYLAQTNGDIHEAHMKYSPVDRLK